MKKGNQATVEKPQEANSVTSEEIEQRIPRLMKRYYPVVRNVVKSMFARLPSYVDEEELHSVGIKGLVAAVKKYDPEQEATFEGYVALRIRGAILDELRKMDRLPRTARQKARRYQRTQEELEQELGRVPTEIEMRERMELNPTQYRRMQTAIQPIVLVSLDRQFDREQEGESNLHECLADDTVEPSFSRLEKSERSHELAERITHLPERYQKILAMYYYEEMRLCEIAEVFSVSEARICQIHTKALLMLRKTMSNQ